MTTRSTITALVENRPGVLNRVVSIFRRPGLNLDSLTVGRTDRPDVSRMTMVLEGSKADAAHVMRELNRLIHVITVEEMNGTPYVTRDLALIKVEASPENKREVLQICEHYRARIIDVVAESILVEVVGEEAEVEGLTELLRPFGIIEMVRRRRRHGPRRACPGHRQGTIVVGRASVSHGESELRRRQWQSSTTTTMRISGGSTARSSRFSASAARGTHMPST